MKYEELTQAPRRRKWPWIVAVLIIAGIALAIAWRWMPPGDATMAEVRAAEVAYESVFAPMAPDGAEVGAPLTPEQLTSLEDQLQTRLEACCAEEFLSTQGQYARSMARRVSTALANGHRYEPTHPYEYLRDLQFRYRTWNGDLVFDVYAPGATRVRGLPVSDAAFVSETITFTKDDGVWKIAGDQHFGG